MITSDLIVEIGYLSRTHGKQGDLQCQVTTDLIAASDPEFVVLAIDGIYVPFRLIDWRQKSADAYILSLQGLNDEQQAQTYVGCRIFLLREQVTDDTDQPLTLAEFIGYQVIDAEHGPIGKIIDIDDSTLNALFLLDNDIVLPAHDDFVQQINPATQQIFMHLPEGII